MSKETSDPSTVDEGHLSNQRHHTIVSHLDTASSTKLSTRGGVTATNMLANSTTHAAESASSTTSESVSSRSVGNTRHAANASSRAHKTPTRGSLTVKKNLLDLSQKTHMSWITTVMTQVQPKD